MPPLAQAYGVNPGNGYNVAETVPTGWDLTSATCDDGSPVTNIDVSANETVTKGNVSYLAGPSTSVLPALAGTFTPTPAVALSSAQVAGAFAGSGVNTVHWNPLIAFVLSANQTTGLYTGTITQSIA